MTTYEVASLSAVLSGIMAGTYVAGDIVELSAAGSAITGTSATWDAVQTRYETTGGAAIPQVTVRPKDGTTIVLPAIGSSTSSTSVDGIQGFNLIFHRENGTGRLRFGSIAIFQNCTLDFQGGTNWEEAGTNKEFFSYTLGLLGPSTVTMTNIKAVQKSVSLAAGATWQAYTGQYTTGFIQAIGNKGNQTVRAYLNYAHGTLTATGFDISRFGGDGFAMNYFNLTASNGIIHHMWDNQPQRHWQGKENHTDGIFVRRADVVVDNVEFCYISYGGIWGRCIYDIYKIPALYVGGVDTACVGRLTITNSKFHHMGKMYCFSSAWNGGATITSTTDLPDNPTYYLWNASGGGDACGFAYPLKFHMLFNTFDPGTIAAWSSVWGYVNLMTASGVSYGGTPGGYEMNPAYGPEDMDVVIAGNAFHWLMQLEEFSDVVLDPQTYANFQWLKNTQSWRAKVYATVASNGKFTKTSGSMPQNKTRLVCRDVGTSTTLVKGQSYWAKTISGSTYYVSATLGGAAITVNEAATGIVFDKNFPAQTGDLVDAAGEHGVTPQFTDSTNADYTLLNYSLQLTSPLIDVGPTQAEVEAMGATWPTLDAAGATRSTTTPSIGAYDSGPADPPPVGNVAPVAIAGDDTAVSLGNTFQLYGEFVDPNTADSHTFLWEDITVGGPVVTLTGSTTQTVSGTPTATGVITLRFTVDDGTASHSDTVLVTVSDVVVPQQVVGAIPI